MMESEGSQAIELFHEWLRGNGAIYDKIIWPTYNEEGLRSAFATDDIAAGETMICIPQKLMMSPVTAYQDPQIGKIFSRYRDILRGDLLVTIFLMYERSKGEASFYFPYIRILPQPCPITDWNNAELDELQDSRLVHRSQNKAEHIQFLYEAVVIKLIQDYPGFFHPEHFTFANFCFAFNTIQARAFGKRLPWTALVPFADCLNHSNVQTKYDYNVDGNGVFRLYPSSNNSYNRDCEVFNSYGKRPNDNLLLDYGFAMLDNMWEQIELWWRLSKEDPYYDRKLQCFRKIGHYSGLKKFSIKKRNLLPLEMIYFLRIAETSEEELIEIENLNENQMLPIITISLELRVVHRLVEILQSALYCMPTTKHDDNARLQFEKSSDDKNWKMINSLNYRITRKNLLSEGIQFLERVVHGLKIQSIDVLSQLFSPSCLDECQYLGELQSYLKVE